MENICRDIQEQIPELVTGALPRERADELRQHIGRCPACTRYLQALQADDKLLGDFTEGMQPTLARLEDKVIEELNREQQREPVSFIPVCRTIRKSAITKVAAAAVIIVVALIVIKLFPGRVEQKRSEIVSSQNASHRWDEDIASSVFVEDEKPEVAAPREVAITMRERTKPALDAELEAELWMVRELIAAGDIDGLVAMLEHGEFESKLAAANYLAKIGDVRAIETLEKLSAEYGGNEPNNLFALAIRDIKGSVASEKKGSFAVSVISAVKGRGWEKAKNLDGKEVVVRLYKDWRTEAARFETVSVRVAEGSVDFDSIKFDSNEVGETVVAVFGEDQKDVNVAEAMGDCIYAEPYKKGLRLSLPVGQFPGKEGLTVVFHDAFDANVAASTDEALSRGRPIIGKPIPEAEVEIFLRAYEGARIHVGRYLVDEHGTLAVPRTGGSLNWFEFIVSHPEYGIAWVSKTLRESMTVISLPLVRRDSVAGQRAIWGTIVDPQGNPVAGATIECRSVRTLGEGLINSIDESAKVISDANGFFTFYMPNVRRRDERGLLIPPKSRYQVKIEAPEELELLPYSGGIMNGQESRIIMEWGDYFRTFVFEDDSGPISDPERLQTINIIIERKGKERLRFGYNDWKDAGRFPLGTYQAILYGAGEPSKFEPLEVTEDSPEQLIFRLPESIVYHGRVVEGLTGEPMQGAFVISMWGRRERNLSQITPEQWELLHELPADPCVSDKALEPIQRIYGFKKAVRTDEDGRFEMSFQSWHKFYEFIAFDEDYLGVKHRVYTSKAGKNRPAEVPVLKLYPAAKVVIEPHVEGKHISIWPRWVIDKDDNPAWVRDFLATDDRSERFFTYDGWLKQNEVQTFHVPAGLNLRIKLDTPYDTQWCPIDIDETINLQQGQTYDLGRHTFDKALKVFVKVVNSAGESVEGVPVRKRIGDSGWDVPHNTDEKGVARFNLCPYSEGEFSVMYEENTVYLREAIPYEIAGEEDSGASTELSRTSREFTLTLSDEMLYHLFK